jgi:hypothetical protein
MVIGLKLNNEAKITQQESALVNLAVVGFGLLSTAIFFGFRMVTTGAIVHPGFYLMAMMGLGAAAANAPLIAKMMLGYRFNFLNHGLPSLPECTAT